eukprot:m.111925 g.111925  ORF g.111925 m.111925 type:complete len:192 (+) comp9243_c2_seq6:3550-4125(+)
MLINALWCVLRRTIPNTFVLTCLLCSPPSSIFDYLQHTESGQGGLRYYVVPHGTEIFFLQNDAAFALWPPTKRRVTLFKKSLGIPCEDEEEDEEEEDDKEERKVDHSVVSGGEEDSALARFMIFNRIPRSYSLIPPASQHRAEDGEYPHLRLEKRSSVPITAFGTFVPRLKHCPFKLPPEIAQMKKKHIST